MTEKGKDSHTEWRELKKYMMDKFKPLESSKLSKKTKEDPQLEEMYVDEDEPVEKREMRGLME